MADLVRWNPYRSWLTIREAMDRLLEEAFMPAWSHLLRWPEPLFTADFWPFGVDLPVDMYETENDLVIRAALPGIREDKIEIEERDGVLTIRAGSKTEDEHTAFGWHIRERGYGLWQRSLHLPVRVKADKARAELKHGVLTITLPKAHTRKPLVKKIKVGGILPKIRWPQLGRRARAIPMIAR